MNAHLSKPEMALFRSPIGLISSLRSSSFYGHPFPGEGLRNVAEFSLRGRRVSFSCTSLLGCSYHPSPSVERLLGPSFYATNASWRNFRLPCRSLLLVLCSCVHTQSGGMLAAREKPVQQKGSKGHEHGSVLMQFVSKKEEPKQLTVGAKVAQAGRDMTYILVILGGFALTGFLFWSVGSEFFSSSSSSSIFTKALKRVKEDPRVVEVLGEPITGHGDHSGRGRRRHITHQEYIVEGTMYMRMKFYVDGTKRKGTVHLDLKKNERGKYECRFLFVELQGYPPGTIIIEDNR